MADFDSKLPVRGLALDNQRQIANVAGTTINPVEEFAQASATASQYGPLMQAAVTTAAPTYITGNTYPLSLDTAGNLRITGSTSITGNVTVVQPTGTNLHVVIDSGTTVVTQSSGANLHVNIDNFPADADALAQGSTTAAQLGALVMGAATAAAPTYTTATTNPLSLDLAGNLRVITGTGSTTAVTGNVTVVQPTGTNLHTVVDSGTITVTQASGANLHVNIDNFPSDADALAQGSTTAGQLGALIMGAVTTAAPTYTTGQTDPLSLTTSGALRVAVVSTVSGTSDLVTYNTFASLGAGLSNTQTYTPGTDVYLDGVDASASGQMKVEIQIGGATKCVMFTSKGNLQMMWRLNNPIFVASGTAITVIRTNMDNQSMDVYSNIQTHL